MVVTFSRNDAKISSSSRGAFEYLNKENEERIDEFWDNALASDEDISSIDESQLFIDKNLFFTYDYNINIEKFSDAKDASSIIDNNISSNDKRDQSKFFMMNISPSKNEIDHLNEIADLELKSSGIDIDVLQKSEEGLKQYRLMKNDLVHQQLREYTKDVMKDYANNFNQEVYTNPSNLPTFSEGRKIDKEAKKNVAERGILPKDKHYKIALKNEKVDLAKRIGRDLSTRKLEEKDLVWFAKVEERRTYKDNDKWVMQNNEINKKIKALEEFPKNNLKEIEKLKLTLNRDRTTNEIVKSGMLKGGDNYHVHVIVSRYDNCPIKSRKVSLSPLANHKGATINNTNNVGFNRNEFRNKVEKSFDEKFKFERVNSFENYRLRKNYIRNKILFNVKNNLNTSVQIAIKPVTNEFKNKTGYNEIRNLNFQNTISKELGFRIPMKIPKSPFQASVKIIRNSLGKIMDSSRGY